MKISKMKQKTDTKKDAKMNKSDNFTRSNREKSNIAIAILEKWIVGWHYYYFVFGGIFADCILMMFFSEIKYRFRTYFNVFYINKISIIIRWFVTAL